MDKANPPLWGQNQESKAKQSVATPGDHSEELAAFSEAKLFHNQDRATLTFYLGQQVASIHFDRQRREIFFKGHNVKNMAISQEQWLLLQDFSGFLLQSQADSGLIQAYKECLSRVLPQV